ncbi:MAG TPA: glucan biosynthesis protein G [Terrimicrobiaceae bacterium]
MKTHLFFFLLTAVLLAIVIGSRRKEAFTFEDVIGMAQGMAAGRYKATAPTLPKELRSLTYDQHRDIRWKDEYTLWRRQGLPFQVRFFHPGYIFDRPVEIFHEVANSSFERLRYSPEFFDFGKNSFRGRFPETVGYAGFRIHHPINKPDVLDEVVVFLGASYFRAVPKDMIYGPSARGLALDTAVQKREEEFPMFTKFWLRRPERFAKRLVIYGLLESRSVTGAYQFTVEPGAETRMHVRAVLFFRQKAEHAGYAPMTSMYWFGENTSDTFGDFRPEVHDSDGLLIQHGNGEWLWHPLAWSKQLQLNVFADDHPKGFGLLQRDRDFSHYQDLEALYHKRPGIWVQPLNGFDKGAVRLIQLPTKDEFQDNVAAFWTPAEAPPVLKPVEIEYVLRWFADAQDLPPVGRCISTRVDDQDKPYYRHFFLEFSGGKLAQLKPGETPTAEVSSSTGAGIADVKIEWNDFNKGWRISFYASTPESKKPNELSCKLLWNGEALTETWSYTWMP